MAAFTWYGYMGATPDWTDVSTNHIVFSGSATDLSVPITVAAWQSGSHVGNGHPGTDACGTNHMKNVKYVSSTQFDKGGGTTTLNDTNLLATDCTLRIIFSDAASVSTSNARFYSYDGTTTTAESVGIEAYAFERGVSATTWTQINDDSGNVGGDWDGEHLDLAAQGAATSHTFYIAVSCSPESVGSKTQFEFGIALTYS